MRLGIQFFSFLIYLKDDIVVIFVFVSTMVLDFILTPMISNIQY